MFSSKENKKKEYSLDLILYPPLCHKREMGLYSFLKKRDF